MWDEGLTELDAADCATRWRGVLRLDAATRQDPTLQDETARILGRFVEEHRNPSRWARDDEAVRAARRVLRGGTLVPRNGRTSTEWAVLVFAALVLFIVAMSVITALI